MARYGLDFLQTSKPPITNLEPDISAPDILNGFINLCIKILNEIMQKRKEQEEEEEKERQKKGITTDFFQF